MLKSRTKRSLKKRVSKKKKSRKSLVAVTQVRKLSPKKKGRSTKTKSPVKGNTLQPLALASLYKNMTMKGKNGKVYTSVRAKKSKVWKWVRVSKDYHTSFI